MAIFNIGGWSWPRRGTGASAGDNFTREPVFLGVGSRSGKTVTRETALQVSAILCGARVISQGIAQVPLKLYREIDRDGRSTREPARDHPLYRLVGEQPNDFQTSFSWRETLTLHAVLGGDGYSYINRRPDGSVREILPMSPDDVSSNWDAARSEQSYVFGAGSSRRELKQSEVLHIHGPSWNGFSGLPALALAQEAIGLSIALRDSQSDLFGKGGRPSGILSKDASLGKEAAGAISASWQEKYGPGGKGGVAVLDGGWKFSPMQMTAVDSQTTETMRFLIEEVARFLLVFPQMLMSADKPTYASVEQFFIAHVVYTLDPWMDRIEQEIKRSLIGYEGDNANVYPRFVREGLLRGASSDRANFYKAALGSGGSPPWMTQNEVRGLENLNPLEGGDVLLAPTTVQPPATNPEGNTDA